MGLIVLGVLLLGPVLAQAQPDGPRIDANGTGTYSGSTGELRVTAQPTAIKLASGATVPLDPADPAFLKVSIFLDNTLTFIPGVPVQGQLLRGGNLAEQDFLLTGRITLDGQTHEGTLLAGEILDSPDALKASSPEKFILQFRIVSGDIAGIFGGVGATFTVSTSVSYLRPVPFPANQESTDFRLSANGTSLISVETPASICAGRISGASWIDTNHDGQLDASEAPAPMLVRLYGPSGQVVGLIAGSSFEFRDLCAGQYVLRTDESTDDPQPPTGNIDDPCVLNRSECNAPPICRPPFCVPFRANGAPVPTPSTLDPVGAAAAPIVGDPFGTSVTLQSNSDAVVVNFPIPPDPNRGGIRGHQWRDADNDGAKDFGEQGLQGFVTLSRGSIFYSGRFATSTGAFAFLNLPDGAYTVCTGTSLVPANAANPSNAPGCIGPLQVVHGHVYDDVDFRLVPQQLTEQTAVRVSVKARSISPGQALAVPIRFDYSVLTASGRRAVGGTLAAAFDLTIAAGEALTVEAPAEIALSGGTYRFVAWETGVAQSTNARVTFRPDDTLIITAKYELKPAVVLRFRAEDFAGTPLAIPIQQSQPVAGTPTTPFELPLAYNTPVSLKAPPVVPGAVFMYWRIGSSVLTFQTTINGTVNSNLELVAVYRRTQP